MTDQSDYRAESTNCRIEEVIAAEKIRIAQHRMNRNVSPDSPYFGLCLSGGGIRSASFALGVLQALNRFGLLAKFDYLSSVSGGGYIGSSFTWFNHVQANAGGNWEFPFGTTGFGTRSSGHETPLNYLRQHCDYLNPTAKLNSVAGFANFFRNSLLSFTVYFLLIVTVFCVLTRLGAFASLLSLADSSFRNWNGALVVTGGLLLLFALLTVIYGAGSYLLNSMSKRDYYLRVAFQRLLGMLVSIIVIFAVLGSLPFVFVQLDKWLVHTGGAMSLFGALGSAYGSRKEKAAANKQQEAGSSMPVLLAALVSAYGLALLAYAAARFLLLDQQWPLPDVFLALFLPSLLLGVFVNTNNFGPGRYYRDRLMEAFMPGRKTVQDDKWRPAVDADKARISDMCGANEQGPYHLLNCTVILVDSQDARFRGRGGDSFTLSPLYCGSNATGWFDTRHFLGNNMTLATAMSISGAALSPNAANNGSGATRNRVVSFLLSLLNLRLGYSAANPAAGSFKKLVTRISQPNFYFPGLSGLLGGELNEKAAYLALSDGGHFEDCGLYELARRKLDLIMICEAGADPDYTLSDLANAIERIRVDFGYHIDFPDGPGDFGIADILPGSDGNMIGNDDIKLARRGFAIGNIYYDETHSGKIIYLQSVLAAKLPPDIFSFRKLNASFPNDPTSKQFFTETQLEAYRELGYQLCKDMALTNSSTGAAPRWI